MAPLFHRRPPNPDDPQLTFVQRQRVFWRTLSRIALILLALAAVVYLVLQLVARSHGFRNSLEGRLSRLSGIPLHIDGRVRATEALNLKIRGIRGVEGDTGLSIDTARLRWRMFPPDHESRLSSIWLEGVRLSFATDAEGAVHPAFLGAMVRRVASLAGIRDAVPDLPDPAAPDLDIPVPTPVEPVDASPADYGFSRNPLSNIPLIRVQNASLHWRDPDGNEIATASGIDFTWHTLPLPELGMMPRLTASDVARVSYLRGYADHVRLGRTHITGLRLEFIQAGSSQYLVLLEAEDWGALPPPRPAAADAQDLFREFFPQ